MNDHETLKLRIAERQTAHRGLDQIITQMAGLSDADQLALRRMKKRRLPLKDNIVHLQMQRVPDVLA